MAQLLVEFADAELLVAIYLRTQLPLVGWTGITVVTQIPNPRPTQFVLLQRTGGPKRDLVTDSAQISFEAWSNNHTNAHDLMASTRMLVNGLRNSVLQGYAVYRIQEFSGPQNLPDPAVPYPRYIWTAIIDIRGKAPS